MTTAVCLVPKCWCITTSTPEQWEPWQDAGHALLCCAVPWQWHPSSHLHSSAAWAAWTAGVGHAPASPAHRCSALEIHFFGFGHRRVFQETATVSVQPGRRKAFLLRWCPCLRKLSVHLCLPGVWDPVSLKPSLREELRVASCPS